MKPLALALGATLSLAACGGTADVTRVYSPDDAARVDQTKMQARALVRNGARQPLPRGARVTPDRVVLSVAGPTPTEQIPLFPSDGVEMQGKLGPGDSVPGGGHVALTRSSGALIAGSILLALTWVPTAYVGLGSRRSEDRVLMIPVLGPWIDWAGRPACVPPAYAAMLPVDPCIEETASRAALVASGGLQLLGGVLVAMGLPTHAELIGADRRIAVVPTPGGVAAIGGF